MPSSLWIKTGFLYATFLKGEHCITTRSSWDVTRRLGRIISTSEPLYIPSQYAEPFDVRHFHIGCRKAEATGVNCPARWTEGCPLHLSRNVWEIWWTPQPAPWHRRGECFVTAILNELMRMRQKGPWQVSLNTLQVHTHFPDTGGTMQQCHDNWDFRDENPVDKAAMPSKTNEFDAGIHIRAHN